MTVPSGRLFETPLAVADLDRSLAFYREQLGLELAHRVPERQAAFLWIGRRGDSMLGLWGAEAVARTSIAHIAFATTLDAVLAAPGQLRSMGVASLDFNGEPTGEPVVLAWMPAASVYFRDPDGHLLEYIAMLDDAPKPEAGVVTWQQWTGACSSGRVGS